MPEIEDLITQPTDEIEMWFLSALEETPLPLAAMLTVLEAVAARAAAAVADEWAELLQDALRAANDTRGALRLLKLRCAWQPDPAAFRATCRDTMLRTYRGTTGKAFIEGCGFDNGIDLPECLRRLDLLMRLAPKVICHEKTWGFGVVKDTDSFYGKVIIDFTRKPRHPMSFAYAAETLELLADDHLLARRHRDPEGFAELLKSRPDEVVRIAIRSFGELSMPLLQERMLDGILSEDEWKPFWDGARRGLKSDPLVEVPTRRNAPIRLLAKAKAYDDEWFAALSSERHTERVIALLAEYERQAGKAGLPAAQHDRVAERLGYAIHAFEGSAPHGVARAFMMAQRFGVTPRQAEDRPGSALDLDRARDGLLEPAVFVAAAGKLPARELRSFFDYLWAYDAERVQGTVMDAIPDMPINVLSEVVEVIAASGLTEAFAERMRDLVRERQASVMMLCWCCRNLERVDEWGIISLNELLIEVVQAMSTPCGGESLRAQNQIRTLTEDSAWVGAIMAGLDDFQRRGLMARIRDARGWNVADRRSVMAKMVKLHPELEAVLRDDSQPEQAVATTFTSWHAYRARQAQLKKLIEVDIPANSREIALARSYGDLSENHEYKAAKEHQGILLKRRGEMERDLEEVVATDFATMPSDVAGIGTAVTVRYDDGTTARHVILGEWDRDEALGIVPSRSRLAEALSGKQAGDRVAVPRGDESTAAGEITAVSPLPEDVREWVMGRA